MLRSKFGKIIALIIGLLVLCGIILYTFYNNKSNDTGLSEIPKEQAYDDNLVQEPSDKNEQVKDKILTPVQKYYKDYLEQDELSFLNKAKSSENNDLEFNKLQMKFIKATDTLNEKYSGNIDTKDTYYQNNWVKISCIEGIYFYSVNSEYLQEKFGKYLSPAYNEWLKFTVKRETVMQDGGLSIPTDKLREYIIFLEKFTEQYPEFVLINDVKDILESYLMTYLEGIDNSPIFDKWNTRKMKPEFKTSYEKFLSENKDSKYYPMVEELYNKSRENDFTWDRDFDQWLYEYHKKYFAD